MQHPTHINLLFVIAVGLLLCAAPLRAGDGGGVSFVDEAAARGLVGYSMAPGKGGGVAVVDYDEDGDLDMFVPTAEDVPNLLFRNHGDGTFEEIAGDVGLASVARSRAALWVDIDGDHRLDLVVAGDCWERTAECLDTPVVWLYQQADDGTFNDVTAGSGLLPDAVTKTGIHRGGIAAGDLNGDGALDIVTGLWSGAARVLVNDGRGHFLDTSAGSLVGEPSFVWQPGLYDFNGDGALDMYFAIDFEPNRLWINDGVASFSDTAFASGLDSSWNDMGLALGDIDNDGMIDISVTEITVGSKHNRLYRRTAPGAGGFVDISVLAGTAPGDWSWGTILFDADNDGWLDLAVTNGWFTTPWSTDQSRFFRNLGMTPVLFEDASVATGFDDTFWGSCIIDLDVDRDGDLDIVQTCNAGGPLRLLINERSAPAAANHALTIRPRMVDGGNHWAIGSTVRIEAGGLSMMRVMTAGTSYMGQAPAEAFFGLGAAAVADEVRVEWPDGTSRVITNVGADQVLTITNTIPEDVDQDGSVAFSDLLRVLSGWGRCARYCPADVDGSGVVDFGDLLSVLSAWG